MSGDSKQTMIRYALEQYLDRYLSEGTVSEYVSSEERHVLFEDWQHGERFVLPIPVSPLVRELEYEDHRYAVQTERPPFFEYSVRPPEWNFLSGDVVPWHRLRTRLARMLLVGAPGMGKSTLLREEGWRIAQEQKMRLARQVETASITLPISLDCADLAHDLMNSHAPLAEVLCKRLWLLGFFPQTLDDWLRSHITGYHCILLLDRFEGVEKDQRTFFLSALYRYALETETRFFISIRQASYDHEPFVLPGAFQVVRLQPFDLYQKKNWIHSRFADQPLIRERFQHDLNHAPLWKTLTSCPLICSLLAQRYEQQGTLPENRATLYTHVVSQIMHQTYSDASLGEQDLHALETFAWHMASTEGTWHHLFTEQQLQPYMSVPSLTSDLPTLWRSFVTPVANTITPRYHFQQTSWHAFFVASYLIRHYPKAPFDQCMMHQDEAIEWDEVSRFLAGLLTDTPSLLSLLKQAESPISAGLFAIEANPSLLETVHIRPLVKILAALPVQQRLGITWIIRLLSSIWLIDDLLALLLQRQGDPDEATLVVALGDVAHPATTPQIGLIALNATLSFPLRCLAIHALGKSGGEQALSILKRVLQDQQEQVRGAALWALSECDGEEVDALLLSALHDPLISVKSIGIWALGRRKCVQAVPQLIARFGEKNAFVRRCLKQACKIIRPFPVDRLFPLLSERQQGDEVRTMAVEVISSHTQRTFREMFPPLLAENHIQVRRAALHALGCVGENEWVASLMQVILQEEEGYQSIKEDALQALSRIGGPIVEHALWNILTRENVGWRIEEVLSAIAGQESVQIIHHAAKKRLPQKQYSAMVSVASGIHRPDVLDFLTEVFQQKQVPTYLRERAFRAVLKQQRPVERKLIQMALQDSEGELVQLALQYLLKEPSDLLPEVMERFNDPSAPPGTRGLALEVLGMDGEHGMARVLQALHNPQWRFSALNVLEKRMDDAYLSLLLRWGQDLLALLKRGEEDAKTIRGTHRLLKRIITLMGMPGRTQVIPFLSQIWYKAIKQVKTSGTQAELRHAIIVTLGKTGGNEAKREILQILDQLKPFESKQIRDHGGGALYLIMEVMTALTQIGDPTVILSLVPLLWQNYYEDIRTATFETVCTLEKHALAYVINTSL